MQRQQTIRRFSILAVLTFLPVQAGLVVVDSFWPSHPHLMRFLALFLAVKIVGDLMYYGIWPHRRRWVQGRYYLSEELIPIFRFGFPAAICQRIVESWVFPTMAFGYPPSTLAEHLLAGPLVALAIYLANRRLVERADDEANTSIRDTSHLP